MGAVISYIISSLSLCMGYCAYQSASSLCEACFGNSSPYSTGRKRSILLLAITVALALLFQYSWAPSVQSGNYITRIPIIGSRLQEAWKGQCYDAFDGDFNLVMKCMGNAGVYRATFTSFFFFVCMAVIANAKPSFNRSAWPAKYTIFILTTLLTFFVPNLPLFSGIFLWIARLGASLFLVVQQIILIDLAYSWNEAWVQNSIDADSVEYGTGGKWLVAIVAAIVVLYSGCMISVIFLYRHFSGCALNDTLITITLLLIIAITAVQLNSEGGNLLTSATMSVYAMYLLISAVSHNPNDTCNPLLGDNGTFEIIVGLALTFLSLVWTGWSWTNERVLTSSGLKENSSQSIMNTDRPLDGLDIPFLEEQNNYVGGVVVDQSDDDGNSINTSNELWKLNIVLALVSCWITVSLTGWGTIQSEEEIVNLWFITLSQWLAMGLYAWTLAAPVLFPDRDFS